jgi:hypothetical protein
MPPHLLERTQAIPGEAAEIFRFFADAHNLETITPPWLGFRVRNAPGPVSGGAESEYSLRLHGLPVRWVSRIEEWDPPRRFADVQIRGPYRRWHHTHSLEPDGDRVIMRDLVRYSLPFGPVGELVHRVLVRRDLERIFDYRRTAIEHIFG